MVLYEKTCFIKKGIFSDVGKRVVSYGNVKFCVNFLYNNYNNMNIDTFYIEKKKSVQKDLLFNELKIRENERNWLAGLEYNYKLA